MSTVGQSSALNAGLPAATCPAGLADPENRLEKRLAEAVSPVPVGVETDEQPDRMSAAASKAAHLPPRHRGSIFEHRIEFTRSILKTSETLPTALLFLYQPSRGGPRPIKQAISQSAASRRRPRSRRGVVLETGIEEMVVPHP